MKMTHEEPVASNALGARRRPQLSIEALEHHARRLRKQVVRMVAKVGIGYLQQGLGAADIFAALYLGELQLDESNARWPDRDRLVLSTAHNTAIFYASMAERGLIPHAALDTYTVDGSPFEVNASERVGPLVEATCGSLGQGLSVAVGMALSLRRHSRASRVYVILGDGELQEGQVWEAAMSAAGFVLDNLCVVIDRNFLQVEGHTDKVMPMEPVAAKWAAFGWSVQEIDGNNMAQIMASLYTARRTTGRPTCIIAKTTPGKGVAFLENRMAHMAAISGAEANRALEAIGDAS
jgi:transketolase